MNGFNQSSPPTPDDLGLLEWVTSLTTGQNRDGLLVLFAEFAAQRLGADRVSVGLLNPDDPDHIEVVALSGTEGDLARGSMLPIDRLALRECLDTAQPVMFDPAGRDELDSKALREVGMTTVANAPLVSGERLYGTLNVACRAQPIDLDTVAQLGRLLASQLDRIALHETLQSELDERRRDAQRWTLLHHFEPRLSSARTRAEVLAAFGEIVAETVSGSSLGLVSFDEDGYRIIDLKGGERRFTADPAAEPFFERVVEQVVCYSPDVAIDTWFPRPPIREESRTVFALTLDSGRRVPRVLLIESHVVDAIDRADRDLLAAVAPLVGASLDRIEVVHRLVYTAQHDPLTGLIRRDLFDELLDAEVEMGTHQGSRAAVALLDVDRFKVVNDIEGFLGGDEFLVELATRVRSMLGAADVATRIGADEFALLLRNRDLDAHLELCGDIVTAVAATPFEIAGRQVPGTVSIGITAINGDTESGREALGHAEAACFAAKSQGGNTVSVASNRDRRQSARRNASQQLIRLRRALDEDRLMLYAQPIVELDSMRVSGFEVLVRMSSGDGDIITPDQFLPVAERYHMIAALDLWVLERALARLGECGVGRDALPSLFINVSPTSITSTGFIDRFEAILNASAVPTNRVCFEITETGTMRSFDEALKFVDRVTEMGARLALDDFGVGLSSLSHLHRLPVDVLKIDGSLINGIDRNPINATMVSTIKAMADALETETVAEHIENQAVLDAVRSVGIDSGQGFFLGRPAVLCDQLSAFDDMNAEGFSPQPER